MGWSEGTCGLTLLCLHCVDTVTFLPPPGGAPGMGEGPQLRGFTGVGDCPVRGRVLHPTTTKNKMTRATF